MFGSMEVLACRRSDPWKCSRVVVRIRGSVRESLFGSLEVLASRCLDPWKCLRVVVHLRGCELLPESVEVSLFILDELLSKRHFIKLIWARKIPWSASG